MGAGIWPLHKGLLSNNRKWKPMSHGVPEFGMPDSDKTEDRIGPSDESLADNVRRTGDTASFAALVTRYRARVTGLARKMLGSVSQDEAEDVAQEAFVSAYVHRIDYRSGMAFRPWLYRIAVNRCLDRLRARSRRPEVLADLDRDNEPSLSAVNEPLSAVLAGEREERLQKAVDGLPPKYRAVFILRHLDDLSYDEIALAMRVPVGTVKTHLFRARAALRHELSGYLTSESDLIGGNGS